MCSYCREKLGAGHSEGSKCLNRSSLLQKDDIFYVHATAYLYHLLAGFQ